MQYARCCVYRRLGIELGSLCGFRRRPKLCAKDFIPKATRNSKAVFIVCVVMLEVVLLERFVVGWKAATAVSVGYSVEGQRDSLLLVV